MGVTDVHFFNLLLGHHIRIRFDLTKRKIFHDGALAQRCRRFRTNKLRWCEAFHASLREFASGVSGLIKGDQG